MKPKTEVKIKKLPTMVAHGAIAWSICMPKTPDTGGQVTDGSIRRPRCSTLIACVDSPGRRDFVARGRSENFTVIDPTALSILLGLVTAFLGMAALMLLANPR